MKNMRVFFYLSENFQNLELKFSIYLNRHVFLMIYILVLCLVVLSGTLIASLRTREPVNLFLFVGL